MRVKVTMFVEVDKLNANAVFQALLDQMPTSYGEFEPACVVKSLHALSMTWEETKVPKKVKYPEGLLRSCGIWTLDG